MLGYWHNAGIIGRILGINGFTCHYNYYYIRVVRRAPYYACALHANVAGRIGNRVSPAESAFSALHLIGIGSASHNAFYARFILCLMFLKTIL